MNNDFKKFISSIKKRRKRFNEFLIGIKIEVEDSAWSFTCPSCGYPTLSERGSYDICILCSWEDDGQDEPDEDKVFGGPNYSLSLTDSRILFETNKVSNWINSQKEIPYAAVRTRIISHFEGLLTHRLDSEKRRDILKELVKARGEYNRILSEEIAKILEQLPNKKRG